MFDPLIYPYRLQALARLLLPRERVVLCHRLIVPGVGLVNLFRLPQYQSARYGNLVTCGSYWMCPVCARKIAARRADEVALLLQRHYGAGGVAVMVTLTMRHARGQPLRVLLGQLLAAWRWVTAYRAYKDLAVVGYVRALEITYSDRAGWHPHLHLLLLLPTVDYRLPRTRLRALWLRALHRHGADGLAGVAFHVRAVDDNVRDASDYVSKAGAVYELTSAQTKRRSLTPWALLPAAASDRSSLHARLWYEYVAATAGRSSLQYARGLRARYGLGEATDAELAERDDDDAVALLLTQFPLAVWQRICDTEMRGIVLRWAADQQIDLIVDALRALGIDADMLVWYDQQSIVDEVVYDD